MKILFCFCFIAISFMGLTSSGLTKEDPLSLLHQCREVHRQLPTEGEIRPELFEREGFLISRSLESSGSQKTFITPTLNFADREHVYTAELPLQRHPWRNQKFQLRVPMATGSRDFCVSYTAQAVLSDQIERFSKTLGQTCEGPIVSAKVAVGEKRALGLNRIFETLSHDFISSARFAEFLHKRPGQGSVEDRKVIEVLSALNVSPCEGAKAAELALSKLKQVQTDFKGDAAVLQKSGARRGTH